MTLKSERDNPIQKHARLKRRRKHRIQLGIFLSIVFLITLVLLYMFTDISYVKSVTITGNHLVTDKKVNEIMNIKKTDRLYSLPVSEIEQNIRMQDGVKSVDVKRIFPNRVNVIVDEYKVLGVQPDGSIFHPVLENGQVLEKYDETVPYEAPIIRDFGRKELKALVRILNQTNPGVRNAISEINFVPNQEASGRMQLFMNDGIEVIGDIRTIGDKLNYYPSMAQKVPRDQNGNLIKPGVIDLEIGSVFIPYESKKAEERRKEMESEAAVRKDKDSKKLEKSVNDLKKQLEDIKNKNKNSN